MILRKLTTFVIFLSLGFAGETGRLVGTITDLASGERLIGVNVSVEGTVLGDATDTNGDFSILNIPAATYNIKVSYIGYKIITITDVVIYSDRSTKLPVLMEISAIQGEEVTVEATRPIIDPDQTATTMTVIEEEIANMPVNSYTDILTNMAGVIENENSGAGIDGVHIRGGRSGEIAYMVDGFFVEDAILGGMGADVARGGISELSVITGSFNAEYGEAMSGVVNIVTREGTTNYEWNIRGATDGFGSLLRKNDWNTDRMEATLSGPIIPGLSSIGSFFVSGDMYSTDTYLKDNYLPKDVLKVDVNGNGIFDEGSDQYAMSDIDYDGTDEEMKKGALLVSGTFRKDKRLTAKLVLRPINKMKLTFGGNFLRREERDFSYDYLQVWQNDEKEWTNSDLLYATLNYTFNADMFATVKMSQFTNEFWEGNPRYLDKDTHEMWAKPVTINPAFDPDYSAIEPGTEWVWFSHYAEPFEDLNLDGNWNELSEEWYDDANNDGIWNIFEEFTDTDGNGIWTDAETFVDANSDGIWNAGEEFTDDNDDGIWNDAESYIDADENGEWYAGEELVDVNGNWIWDSFGTERYMDIDDNGTYSYGITVPLREGDAYDNTSNYEFYGSYPVINTYGDTVRTATSDWYGYRHYSSVTKTYQGSLTWQANKQHQLKTGLELKQYELNNFRGRYLGGGPYGIASAPAWVVWKKTPDQRSFYLQDKIEYNDLIINLGLRWDYMNPNSDFAVPNKPLRYMFNDVIYTNSDLPDSIRGLADWGYIDVVDGIEVFVKAPQADIKKHWSPRIGVGYPVTERLAFHFSYGLFIQYPEYQNMFRLSNSNGYGGLPSEMENIGNYINAQTGAASTQLANSLFGNSMYPFPYSLGDWYIPPVGSPNLKPETTVAYEFGIRDQLTDEYVIHATVFYKDIYDYIAAVIYDADPTEYSVFENMDYGNSKGIEVTLRKLKDKNSSWAIAYTYSRAEGNSQHEYQHWDDAYSASVYGTYPARKTIIMPWDQPHTLNINFDYQHPKGLGVNLIGNMGSGLPYSPSDARGRPLDVSNSGRMPPTAVFNLKAYYDFAAKYANIRLYADVTNLFDRTNILNVYNSSGKADQSLNPGVSVIGEFAPTFYGPPRHIEIGISLGVK